MANVIVPAHPTPNAFQTNAFLPEGRAFCKGRDTNDAFPSNWRRGQLEVDHLGRKSDGVKERAKDITGYRVAHTFRHRATDFIHCSLKMVFSV